MYADLGLGAFTPRPTVVRAGCSRRLNDRQGHSRKRQHGHRRRPLAASRNALGCTTWASARKTVSCLRPLHGGAMCAARVMPCSHGGSRSGFKPLHGGAMCAARITWKQLLREPERFKPLHGGAMCAAPQPCSTGVVVLKFQTPSRRGNVCCQP